MLAVLVSDRFTGAQNPTRLPTLDAIPSKPLRPQDLKRIYTNSSLAGGARRGAESASDVIPAGNLLMK